MNVILQSGQRQVSLVERGFSLPVLAGESPYYRITDMAETGRVNHSTLINMAKKVFVLEAYDFQISSDHGNVRVAVYESTTGNVEFLSDAVVYTSGITTLTAFKAAALDSIITTLAGASYTVTADDIIWSVVESEGSRSFNNTPGRSIVTGTGATGFQVSSMRDAFVTYSPKIVTTATIAGGQDGYTVLEIAATNSATAGDWKELGRVENGQTLSLAIALQSIQPVGAPLTGMVPAGWYTKIRSVNVTGTPTFSSVSGQEVLL